jgi:hypothetical protein
MLLSYWFDYIRSGVRTACVARLPCLLFAVRLPAALHRPTDRLSCRLTERTRTTVFAGVGRQEMRGQAEYEIYVNGENVKRLSPIKSRHIIAN